MNGCLDLSYPFTGRWLVRNSPANGVPSHGTHRYASAHAIDFVPVTAAGRTAPITLGSLVKPDPATRFPGFGRAILAPVTGRVVAVRSQEPDHPAYRGVPSIRYALTQAWRAAQGWVGLAGNHVLIEHRDTIVTLCHLRRDSVVVHPGQHVRAGETIAGCGNSGNSTEPHVHVQAFSSSGNFGDIGRSFDGVAAVRISFNGALPANGDIIDA